MQRVIINGARGKMGTVSCQAIENSENFELVASLSRGDDLATAIKAKRPDIVIDFTNAEVAFANAQTIIDAGVHPVIGSSGLNNEQIEQLQRNCDQQQLGGIIAPNFSIGAILMMRYASDAARYFNDAEIIETHHQQKLDSPSGTALKTADMMAENRANAIPPVKMLKETIPGARGATHHEIPIHSMRLPGTVAQQQVVFGGLGETLTINHNSINRECFMPGVILACSRVTTLQSLVYGLEQLID